ncbi:hypothetical protein [Bradyrhizobium iriomotense]|uniref:Uncharacterized protein n=1 Tax=Bradyrhizobium iriomotense TaxID=441950 RepID=A0ABQ6B6P2_9BRAD|nr:hypothetical protein [Bradyrhizobium iriomotense]GLR90072.1 hypothetical protein GCM10007857_67860 [Bradyrhizobium iriomotense]
MRGFDNFGVRLDVRELTRLQCSICWVGYAPVGAPATSAIDSRFLRGVLTEPRG